MIKNNLKIALRTLWKNKVFSGINILGLALGLSVALIIGLWVNNELTFDRFYSHTDRLYQVNTLDNFDGKAHTWGGTPAILGPILQQEHPEIEEMVRTANLEHMLHVDKEYFRTQGVAADPAFFRLFDFHFLEGNAETAINTPNSLVLTTSMAKKLFGMQSALGKTVAIDSITNGIVKAVVQDIPQNSTFYGTEFFCDWDFLKLAGWHMSSSWTSYNHTTYVLLKENVNFEHVNNNIANLVQKQTNNTVKASIYLYPASRWHLYDKSENGKMVEGNMVNVRMFTLIGFFILLIACINFINLSTASAEKRAKEVGVRKAVGAPRKSLIGQFLLESFLLTLLAAAISVLLTVLALPFFNTLIKSDIHIREQVTIFWPIFIGAILFTALAAGIYPAFVLSAFEPIKTLKGALSSSKSGFKPRQILVAIQFTISICLGICTLIIAQQIKHGQNREKGYDAENLVFAYMDGDLKKNYGLIRSDLLEKGVATSVTKSLGRISHYASNSWGYSWPNSKPEDYDVVFNMMSTDVAFSNTMGVKIIQGRDIDSYKFPTDSTAILLNQAAVKRMGLSDPIGAQVVASKGTEYEKTWHVVGVIHDFIWKSPYADIEPMIVQGPVADWFNFIHVRFNTQKNLADNMKQLELLLKKYNPKTPVDIRFVDEAYNSKFVQQQRTGTLTAIFSGLAIFIACLGLLGLVSFATVQRQKEIGIRKVLGASVSGIVTMLSKDFLKLVILALVIASPIAWWIMSEWLTNFTYRIDIHWWTFVCVGLIATLIALLTVSSLAIRAAKANPVNSLRDE